MRYLGMSIPGEMEKLRKEKNHMLLLKDKNYLEKTGKPPNSCIRSNNPLRFSSLTYPLPRDPLNHIQRHAIKFI